MNNFEKMKKEEMHGFWLIKIGEHKVMAFFDKDFPSPWMMLNPIRRLNGKEPDFTPLKFFGLDLDLDKFTLSNSNEYNPVDFDELSQEDREGFWIVKHQGRLDIGYHDGDEPEYYPFYLYAHNNTYMESRIEVVAPLGKKAKGLIGYDGIPV